MTKKWLIIASQEPEMIKNTIDNGMSLRQLIIGIGVFLAFQAIRKGLKNAKFKIKICCMLIPVLQMVILASVKLSGELMQDIHQI